MFTLNESPAPRDGNICVSMPLDYTPDSIILPSTLPTADFNRGKGETVHFGIGSFGPQSAGNIGKCYKMYLEGVDTIVVGQVREAQVI